MSAPTSQVQQTAPRSRELRPSRRGILLAGVLGVPLVLLLAFNSYGPLTEESALRMAFATVAGQTVAILSALAALAVTVARRRVTPASDYRLQVILFAVIVAVVVLYASEILANAGDVLLSRLDLVAETDLLNR